MRARASHHDALLSTKELVVPATEVTPYLPLAAPLMRMADVPFRHWREDACHMSA